MTEVWHSAPLGSGSDTAYDTGINATLEGAKRFVENEVDDYFGEPVEWKKFEKAEIWQATWNEAAYRKGRYLVSKWTVGE